MPASREIQSGKSSPQIRIVLSAVFLAYLGQTTLNPVIAPLSREVGLAEWQIGLTISVAAVMVVLTSQPWGRRSQSWGRKPVLAAALGGCTAAMVLFAVIAALGMRGALGGTPPFCLFVLARGLIFGTALAAILPTAQAYVADITTDEEERVRGMAGIGAAQGTASIAGALVGGLLSGISLMVSVDMVPVFLLLGLLVVTLGMRRETRTELVAEPARVRPLDSRVWPFLVAGFGMFTAMGLIQVVTGFLVQDRLRLDANTTGLVSGGALLAAGVGMVFAQSVIVPRSKWSPPTLLRVGTGTGAVGFALLAVDGGAALLIVAVTVIGAGIGIGMPGYTAGPTLRMSREEQGGLAGLVGATNGLTYVVSPTAGTAMYGRSPVLPIVVGGAILALVFVFALVHRSFRRAPAAAPAVTAK
ncbi:MFS transporter [Propionibacterium australiense]|uniref:MFS n=1 Tax=Propionibacterium australiense TaxID=119981 RepID=A0A383S5T0_9ACTN|nr:MFS transporter [Propionibacterium australiense]RLP10011.1 MFS transporter [Propionibacterium australiense]RLP11296.1 MFS transporter [Propionibacterium australiense]SYZ32922.1 MFS [Propionibacterium australiense]VEH92425.1 Tetracycline resistance protein, class C [Propionibacterium australiense]